MSNFCLLPTPDQKNYAEYLGRQYGESVKEKYLAVATNPYPHTKNQFASGKREEPEVRYLDLRQLLRIERKCLSG